MQNIINKSYTNKVINIKSELLFREAEDDFYYFYKLNSAVKKLKTALNLTPFHLKSLIMYADICFIKGNIEKSVILYKKAEKINPYDTKLLASLSNCYYYLKNPESALMYCEKAIESFKEINYSLFTQLIEIKINCLLILKRYKEVSNILFELKNNTEPDVLNSAYLSSISEKLKLKEKLSYSGLKII